MLKVKNLAATFTCTCEKKLEFYLIHNCRKNVLFEQDFFTLFWPISKDKCQILEKIEIGLKQNLYQKNRLKKLALESEYEVCTQIM